MAKDYTAISKKGWMCVQSKTGIFCHRTKAPMEIVDFTKGDDVLIVDAIRCKTKITDTGRRHTLCKFKKR